MQTNTQQYLAMVTVTVAFDGLFKQTSKLLLL